MKKIIAMLLAAIMCISLCSCGESKDDVLKKSETISAAQIDLSNPAKVKQDFSGKYISVTDTVSQIGENYVKLSKIKAFMKEEELVKIESGMVVTVAGKIDDFETEDSTVAGSTYKKSFLVMKSAYLVKKEYTVSGAINKIYKNLDGRIYGIVVANIEGNNWNVEVRIPEEKNSMYSVGTNITATGCLMDLDHSIRMLEPVFSNS